MTSRADRALAASLMHVGCSDSIMRALDDVRRQERNRCARELEKRAKLFRGDAGLIIFSGKIFAEELMLLAKKFKYL